MEPIVVRFCGAHGHAGPRRGDVRDRSDSPIPPASEELPLHLKISVEGGGPQLAAALSSLGTSVTVWYIAVQGGAPAHTAVAAGLAALPGALLTQSLAGRKPSKRDKRP